MEIIMTQSSSRARVKQDTIGSEMMMELYNAFSKEDLEVFRDRCFKIIEVSSAKPQTKSKFNVELNKSNSKKHMMVVVTNFFLAGEGKGV
jgi:hypothetical protein